MTGVNEHKLYDFIKNSMEDIKLYDLDELVLMIMGVTFLEDKSNFRANINTLIVIPSIVTSIVANSHLLLAGSLTLSAACGIHLIKDSIKGYQLTKLKDCLAEELFNRFDSFLEAYKNISKLVQSVEREDLLDYFRKADAYNE